MGLTEREQGNRTKLQDQKPLVWKKVQEIPAKIQRGESVALIQLQYNYMCNFRCKHCAIERFKQKRPTLTIPAVKSIADQADALGLVSICISGGEPLLFPDLAQVVQAIGPDRFVVSMDTNGYLLSEEKIKWLVAIGVSRIHLSIDGLEQNHSMFRGNKESWGKCIASVVEAKAHGLGVVINIVPTKSMIKSGELIRELDYLKKLGEHASLIFPKAVGSFEQFKDEILDTKDIEYLHSLAKEYNISTHLTPQCGHEFGCLCFKRHFSITAYGDVLPCPWIPIKIGNVLQEGLKEIIDRGLGIKWFSYANKLSCLSGNTDSEFYKRIVPQIEAADEYPADWRTIKWE